VKVKFFLVVVGDMEWKAKVGRIKIAFTGMSLPRRTLQKEFPAAWDEHGT
jgi:hypothetical protein